jgi:hypothetical protein
VSQLLLRDIPYGSQVIPGRIRTLDPNVNFMTSYDEWLTVQNGCDREQTNCDDVRRFIRNGRDLGQYVHVDMDFNAFYNAAFLLFSGRDPLRRCEATSGLGIEWARCLPYNNPMAPGQEQFPDRPPPPPLRPGPLKSNNQLGVGTFGPQHLVPLLVYAVHLSFLAVWYQKWSVHRRIRPEEYGGRVHAQAMGWASYGVPNSLLTSALFTAHTNDPRRNILAHNRLQNGNRRRNVDGPELCPLQPGALPPCSGNRADGASWLLPMEYAEGCPLHPAYGSGHATAAGACATLLKVFFSYLYPENLPEPVRIVNPVVPTDDGLALVPYTEGDADDLTIEGEINKLASNIALGRNFAGVHWRSDYTEAMRLGECVAVSLLEDQACLFQEPYTFSFRSFDGHDVTITRRGRAFACPPKPTKPCPRPHGHPGEPRGGAGAEAEAEAESERGEEAPAGRDPQRPDREPAPEKPAPPPPSPRPKKS